jgi:mannan endo-1,4-beta-mannosidase
MTKLYLLPSLLFFLLGTAHLCVAQQKVLSDKKATDEAQNLYMNMDRLMQKGVMFGHQDDLAYGVKWKYESGRSDVKDVVNDYPAVFGWDIAGLESDSDKNIDGVPFPKMKAYIKWVYDNGGINTISWHMQNPLTKGSAWDTTRTVSAILPGGSQHELYRNWLDKAAVFLDQLKGSDGKSIPILFRPFHELNGFWFWWGGRHATKEEYIRLWQFTVTYLRDEKKLHHLIYVYNTNSFASQEEFMEKYPGDEFTDMMSFDSYCFAASNASEEQIKQASAKFNKSLKHNLRILHTEAKKHNKIPALAETGFEGIPDKLWWTGTLLDALKQYPISYVLLWRNHGWQKSTQRDHYYAPYKGQISAADFNFFYQDKATLFKNEIAKESMYQLTK